MTVNKNKEVFFQLLQAGLWEKEVRLASLGSINYDESLRLAEEQSVVGIIAAGLEHVVDIKAPKEVVLQFVGQALQLEQRNQAMNYFIGVLVEKMRIADIYLLLVKGQGIAQCYERPLWRASGDVDFFLSDTNYEKAKAFLTPIASSTEKEEQYGKHFGMTIDPWTVELHGTLRGGLSRRMDRVIDEAQYDVFYGGNVRSWMNEKTVVFLPAPDNDVIFVFTHFIKHFYKEGVGLRQICDWTRLLWKYRNTINRSLLEKRIRSAGLLSEWRAFSAFAVEYLGMPTAAMPLYDDSGSWKRKADRICLYVIDVGNMGHNDNTDNLGNKPYLLKKMFSFGRKLKNLIRISRIFPKNTVFFLPYIVFNGVRSVIRGE